MASFIFRIVVLATVNASALVYIGVTTVCVTDRALYIALSHLGVIIEPSSMSSALVGARSSWRICEYAC